MGAVVGLFHTQARYMAFSLTSQRVLRDMCKLFLLVVCLAIVMPTTTASKEVYLNVQGKALEKCSGPNMALTGFTRNGKCVDENDDAGSHHICIDMASNVGGNFCQVTGQPNWCDSKMACDGDASRQCPVKDWCVCQWASQGTFSVRVGVIRSRRSSALRLTWWLSMHTAPAPRAIRPSRQLSSASSRAVIWLDGPIRMYPVPSLALLTGQCQHPGRRRMRPGGQATPGQAHAGRLSATAVHAA